MILSSRWRDLVRTLFSNLGFTISVFLTVAVTAAFAFLFEASFELVVSLLAVGSSSAIAEHVVRSRQQPP